MKKKPSELDDLRPEDKAAVKNILNKGLAEALLTLAGEHKDSLEWVLENADIDFEYGLELSPLDYFDQYILPEAKKLKVAEEDIAAIRTSIQASPANKIENIVGLNTTFKDNPIIGREFRKAQAQEFGKMIGLNADKITNIAAKDFNWEDVTEASLLPLVKENALSAREMDDLLVVSNLTRLTGNNLPLMKALKTPELNSVADLVALDQSDWKKLLTDHNIPAPKGEASLESYAGRLRQNMELTFPSLYFFTRVIQKEHDVAFQLLDTVERLKAKNDRIIRGTSIDPAALDWTGINATTRKKMEKDLIDLSGFSNTYRHLGIPAIINDAQLNKAQKQRALENRLNALKKFQDNNPSVDLYHTDFIKQHTSALAI